MPADPGNWRELYEEARRRLESDNEARWIIEEASGCSWSELVAEDPGVTDQLRSRITSMLERRAAGEPLQYVLGHWSFRTLDLMVDRRVLIPRPETEQVVEVALAELDAARRRDPDRQLIAVDLGTGSGAVALSIAAERQKVLVWGTDRSPEAIDVASANLAGLGGYPATRVRFAEGSWWSALPTDLKGEIDLAVSNPPYISRGEMATLDPTVRDWEPAAALESGDSGLEAIQSILDEGPAWLRPGAAVIIEIAPHQAESAIDLSARSGFVDARVELDLAGRERVLVAKVGLG